MKTSLLPAVAVAALLSLSACNNPVEEVDTRAPDPMASAIANAGPIDLPPPVTDSVTFRCSDNSLVFVDFFRGDTQVNLRTEQGGDVTTLKAPAAGEPYTAEGYTLTGNPEEITLEQPGKGQLSCHT